MKAIGKIYKVKDNYIAVKTDSMKWKVGDKIQIKKGSIRTLSQNSLYWVYLNWCISNGLKEHGHFHPEGLHLSLKRHFLSEKKLSRGKFKLIEEGSTTDLSKSDFGEYFHLVDMFICDFFELDTSAFWELHQQYTT